jgi:hypothetical protein
MNMLPLSDHAARRPLMVAAVGKIAAHFNDLLRMRAGTSRERRVGIARPSLGVRDL